MFTTAGTEECTHRNTEQANQLFNTHLTPKTFCALVIGFELKPFKMGVGSFYH